MHDIDEEGNQPCAVHWEPPPESAYKWKNKHPKTPKALRIYECHVGISGLESKITSFNEFTEKVFNNNDTFNSLRLSLDIFSFL